MATDGGTEWSRKREFPAEAYCIPDKRDAYIARLEEHIRLLREALGLPVRDTTGAAVLDWERVG